MFAILLDAVNDALSLPPAVFSVAVQVIWAGYDSLDFSSGERAIVSPVRFEALRAARGYYERRYAVEIVRYRPYATQTDIETVVREIEAAHLRLLRSPILTHSGETYVLFDLTSDDPLYSVEETLDERAISVAKFRATYYLNEV